MKTNRNLLIAALGAAALFTLANEASAQRQAPRTDFVTASPKFRQLVIDSDRASSSSVVVTRAGDLVGGRQQPQIMHYSNHQVAKSDRLIASPKHRQSLAEKASDTNASTSGSVGYKATGADGITASPKLRQALDEKTASFQIAPVK